MTNPYRNLPDFCFWSRAMSWPAPGQVDPVVRGEQISPTERVATMGSCFAQHLSRHIAKLGLTYYVAERAAPAMGAAEATARNFGIFSARYGNVYTVKQASQLFDRAFGSFTPADDVWEKGNGFVDAFRPQIEPKPLASIDEVRNSATEHLGYVRDVFTKSHWLVFTLGLTEAWRSRLDGAVYPIAPGVSGGDFDPARYEFVNFGIDEVRSDLFALVDKIHGVNPVCRILLTVSPVPLIATYAGLHVWRSTTYSKAVLRVAAEEAEHRFRQVTYFPSYEVITSPAAGGRYYADDLREVTDLGVQHVMRLFETHYLSQAGEAPTLPGELGVSTWEQPDIVCDEETIAASLANVGAR
jgi:hypothetical protein